MDHQKIKRINSISSEVEEFHPLLLTLFSRLPGITHVEYTHGKDEMGADFVLTKSDQTLNKTIYIGCIVKIGKIRQNHQDLNRQIEECEIERIVGSGTKKIFLNEIWIISNDKISSNAKNKIHHNYRNKNLTFLTGEDITQLINAHYNEYWTDVSIHIGNYLREVNEKSRLISKSHILSGFNSSETYIPQQLFRETYKRDYKNKFPRKEKKLTLEEILKTENLVLVEGMMGTGKSTLLAQYAKQFSDNEHFLESNTLPVLISATELKAKYNGDLTPLITSVLKKTNLEEGTNILFFIDGLDELRLENQERLTFIKNICSTASAQQNIKAVISTRNIDNPELELELEKVLSRFSLCSLTIRQVLTLVGKLCTNSSAQDRLTKDLDKSVLFKVLPKTPISAILLAKLLNENIQEIPSTMTDLYSKYMELSLGRWDMDKGLQSQQEYDVINNVTIDLAKFVLENSLIEVPLGDLENIMETYLSSRNLKVDITYVMSKMISKSDLFLLNNSNNTIQFRHRTFAEFFYAAGLLRDSTAEVKESMYDFYWATCYFFLIGLRRDCPELLNAIDNLKLTSDKYRILRIFQNGNFLLAAYLTPYDVVKKITANTFRDAANLLCEVSEDPDNHPLAILPEVQLLCVFTQALSSTFGYEYFNEAIRERALDIFTQTEYSTRDYTELFLLNSIRIALNQQDAYDTLIEKHHPNLPLAVMAGVLEHSKDNKAITKTLKKFRKNFDKNMSKNQGFNKKVIEIYTEPQDKKLITS